MAAILTKRVNNLALPICMAAMDACWIYLVAWLFSTGVLSRIGNIPVPSPVVLAVLELAAWWFATVLLERTSWPMGVVQSLTGVVGLGAALGVAALTSPPANGNFTMEWLGLSLFSMAVSLALWFIGGYRASEPPTFNQAYNNFRVGLIVIGVCALVTVLLGGPQSDTVWAGVGAVALWFFGWSLGALALGNREVVRRESGSMSAGPWALVLFVSIGGILLIGSVTGVFGAQNLLGLVQTVVTGVIALVGAIIYGIIYVVLSIIGLFGSTPVNIKAATPVPDNGDKHPVPGTVPINDPVSTLSPAVPAEVQIFVTVVATLVVVLVVLWVVSRGVKRTRKGTGDLAAEERESLGAWTLLMQQIRGWLDKLLGRNRGGEGNASGTPEDDLAALRGRPEWSGTLSVRQIYARLQRLAANIGYPRAPQQTPAEYLRVLSTALPDLTNDFTDITAAYLQARYGPLPAPGPAVLAATNAWKRAEPVLEGVKRKT